MKLFCCLKPCYSRCGSEAQQHLSPGCLLEMQNLEPHPRLAKSESRFSRDLRRLCSLKREERRAKVLPISSPWRVLFGQALAVHNTQPFTLFSFPLLSLSLVLLSPPSLSGASSTFSFCQEQPSPRALEPIASEACKSHLLPAFHSVPKLIKIFF